MSVTHAKTTHLRVKIVLKQKYPNLGEDTFTLMKNCIFVTNFVVFKTSFLVLGGVFNWSVFSLFCLLMA